MSPIILKLRRGPLPESQWIAATQDLSVNRFMAPDDIPVRVRRRMDGFQFNYFHATLDDEGRIIWGAMAPPASW